MIKTIKLFPVLLLGLIFLLPMSWPTLAQPRTDYYGPGDSGAYYDFYLDWMYPKGKRPFVSSHKIKPVSTKVTPRTDYYGPGDSGAAYDFYLDWMYPKRKSAPVDVTKIKPVVSQKITPRTDYDGAGDSGAYYDFYLDWMSPRVKPKSPRILPFLTR